MQKPVVQATLGQWKAALMAGDGRGGHDTTHRFTCYWIPARLEMQSVQGSGSFRYVVVSVSWSQNLAKHKALLARSQSKGKCAKFGPFPSKTFDVLWLPAGVFFPLLGGKANCGLYKLT